MDVLNTGMSQQLAQAQESYLMELKAKKSDGQDVIF
jgi:hypothetical protein